MLELVNLFILKLLDTSIGALKNIFMIKNKSFLSALANATSYLFYILLMKKLLSTTSISSIVVTLLAVFLGQYCSQIMAAKFDRTRVWKISITPKSKEEGKIIADKLKENNVPVRTYPCYNNNKIKVLAIDVFSESKEQSSIINEVLNDHEVKFNIVEIKNRF